MGARLGMVCPGTVAGSAAAAGAIEARPSEMQRANVLNKGVVFIELVTLLLTVNDAINQKLC